MPAYKNTDNNTWYVKFRYKNWKDETKWVTKRGFATKRDAVQYEMAFKLRQAGNLDMPFAEFVEVYKLDIQPRIRESTWATKENIINSKLLSYFRNKKVSEIRAIDVIRWQNEMLMFRNDRGEPYSKVYLKTVHNQLSAILNHAVRYYELQNNPARLAGNMGSKTGAEMQIWTQTEYMKFSEAMMDKETSYYAFEMLYWCGIREGELLALTPSDFDFGKGIVRVTKSYQRLFGRDITSEPKTPKGKRTIKMPEFLIEEIQEYIELLGDIGHDERMFVITKYYLYHEMNRGSKEAGVKRIRVHDIRHSHVSLLIDMGFSAVAIAERLGHESIDITLRYAHMFPSVQKEMADQLNFIRKEEHHVGEKL